VLFLFANKLIGISTYAYLLYAFLFAIILVILAIFCTDVAYQLETTH